jgi:hypothetical protein
VHRPSGCRYAVFISFRLSFRPTPICPFLRFKHACNSVPLPSTNPRSFLLYFTPSRRPRLLPLPSLPDLLAFVMRSLITLFSLVASACAYSILTPSNSSGWTIGVTNNVTWTRVNTDANTFTLLLVNQVCSPYPVFSLTPGLILGCFRTKP